MKNNFVTIAEVNYAHANYLKKELHIENIHSIIDFTVSDEGSSDMDKVQLQVQEEKLQDAIFALFKLGDQLGQNPLTEISLSKYEDDRLILVPVDLKDNAFALGKYAITLAKKMGADIKFLHVYFESEGVSSIAAYENFQHTVRVQEEQKAKEKMIPFSKSIREYADSEDFPPGSVHFGLSGGNVIDQICEIADKCNANAILLGPEDKSAVDHEPGVVRKTVRKANVPVIVLPLKDLDPESSINKVVYFAEDVKKMVTHQKGIERLFSKSVSCSLLYSNNIKEEELPEFDSELNLDLVAAETLDMDVLEYLKETGTTLLVFDNPKTGLIAQLFGDNFFKNIMKQEQFPVLFLK